METGNDRGYLPNRSMKMTCEHIYKVLFFIQSAAFTVFIINYSQMSTFVPKPVDRLSADKHYDCRPTATRELFNRSAYLGSVGEPMVPIRRQLSNCTLADIKKRPGVMMLVTTNLAFADIALNMLESVKRIGVCVNTTIIAEDEKAYDLLLKYTKGDPAIHVQKTNSGETDAKEPSRHNRSHYYGILDKRQAYILALLEQGLEVLFADSDTFWFRDPFPYFQGDFDMSLRGWGKNRTTSKTSFCAGFIYLKPTNATIQFMRAWVQALDKAKSKGVFPFDQGVMNGLLKADKPVHVDIKMLDADLFPWGPTFFDPTWQKQNHSTVVMHAASIHGHPSKVSKFKEFGMWLVNVTTA